MGCCGGANTKNPGIGLTDLKLQKTVTVYGDYFDPDLRTILCCLQFCGVKYNFTEVDTLIGEHHEKGYLEVNPTG
jgi:glutathione S-transferase